jgi:hypothetical protein
MNTNTTTNIVTTNNEPGQALPKNPSFIGRYFESDNSGSAKDKFVNYFGKKIKNKKEIYQNLRNKFEGLCTAVEGQKSVGTSGDYAMTVLGVDLDNNDLKPEDIDYNLKLILVIHNLAEDRVIHGFIFLSEKDPKTIELSLICSKIKGGGSYLIENMIRVLKENYTKYDQIELQAVNGVSGVYERRGFKYTELIFDGRDTLAGMKLNLKENEQQNKPFNLRGKPKEQLKPETNQTNVFNTLRNKYKNTPIRRFTGTKSTKNVSANFFKNNTTGGKRRKTHKNGNKKRRITRRRR